MTDHDSSATEETASTAATLFDLRTVIAILFGVFGVMLLLIALLGTDQAELDKAGGVHLSLWTSLVMLVVSAGFIAWVRMAPPLGEATDGPPEDDGKH